MAATTSTDTYISRGSTAHFTVSYLSSLGNAGVSIADALLANCESDYAQLVGWFAGIEPDGLPFQIRLTDAKDGASHPSCASTFISIGTHSAPSSDFPVMRCLLFAEVVEVLMHKQNLHWDCGASHGEALSRVLAADLCLGGQPLPDGLLSAPKWLAQRSQNWVDNTEMTDTDEVANGCGVLFLNWLRFSLGHSWQNIVAAGSPTLAGVYQKLTSHDGAWLAFRAIVDQMFPPDKPLTLKTDNPFKVDAFATGEPSSIPAHLDPHTTSATSQAMAASFEQILRELRVQPGQQPDGKPYLFPEGIREIEFELQVSGTAGVTVKIKVSGGKS
jgi:hypothetical protein